MKQEVYRGPMVCSNCKANLKAAIYYDTTKKQFSANTSRCWHCGGHVVKVSSNTTPPQLIVMNLRK